MTFTGKWIPDDQAFRQECSKIALDLTEFKKNPIYCRYINNDNRSYETAIAFFNYIKKQYPELLIYLEEFKKNDIVGSPTLYKINNGYISPGTLRFIKVFGDISRFQFNSLVEIGSGYGGQCRIIRTLTEIPYTLIDIPESLAIAKAYLKDQPFLMFIPCDQLEPVSADLVISDYCISEMNEAGVDFYINAVIKNCRNGYFTCNSSGIMSYLISELQQIFHQVEVVSELPATTKHNNVIIYAMGNRYL